MHIASCSIAPEQNSLRLACVMLLISSVIGSNPGYIVMHIGLQLYLERHAYLNKTVRFCHTYVNRLFPSISVFMFCIVLQDIKLCDSYAISCPIPMDH